MEHRRIIKQGEVVVATEEDGSIEPTDTVTQGLFVGDTRFLSRFRLSLDGIAPSLMGSGEEKPHQAGYLFTNPALPRVPARSFGLVQRTVIEDEIVTITLAVRNMAIHPIDFVLSIDNGSVWPFENALIGAGLRRYGYTQEADSIFAALEDASGYFEYRRWPEVYSGVPRDLVNVLGRQPDTSRPQAWSAASIFLWIRRRTSFFTSISLRSR